MNNDVGMHHAKIVETKVFLAITPPYIFKQRVMHDCASILDSIAKEIACFHYFSHGASLHHCSFSRMIFTLVRCIGRNTVGYSRKNIQRTM